ncbi:MAG: alpha-ketoglutarate-dependent dioxygenase AlkB [Rhodospirillales bacterium]|nr:alpha-ketoglutarate-dependent dioxygenase AlkB [Rhodospirillales bacterium]
MTATPERGFGWYPGRFDPAAQSRLLADLKTLLAAAPLYRPTMPVSGKPFSVTMSNAGPLGWVSDRRGYRYQAQHPRTGLPWPPIPDALLALWEALSGYPAPPEACLINRYDAGARLGLHCDSDEAARDAPVLSVSLGDTAVFRLGGPSRKDPTRSIRLNSGDVLRLGGASRQAYHGIDRVLGGSSRLLPGGGRINLTLRRVTLP